MKKVTTLLTLLFISLSIFAQSIPRVAHPESVGLSSEQLLKADKVIQKSIDERQIPGAVLAVVRHGKIGYLKAYGNKQIYPDVVPMSENTIFDLASVSKSVSTAICAMILIERGEVRLNDDVSFYLPNFKGWDDGKGNKKSIKVIHLLTHTSGLPSYANVEELKKKYKTPNPEGLMEHIASMKRDFEPETKFQYSCLNFITLQHIIEKVSDKSLQQFALENIFQPLGMSHTSYNPAEELLEMIAPTEKQKDGSMLIGRVHDPLAGIMNGGVSGNAGVFSNAEDLAILSAMLLNEGEYNGVRIMSPATVKAMRSVPAGFEKFGRGLGWDVSSSYASNKGDLLSKSTFGHTGYTGTSIIIDPKTQAAVILLTNRVHPEDKGSVTRLRSLVANVVAGAIVD